MNLNNRNPRIKLVRTKPLSLFLTLPRDLRKVETVCSVGRISVSTGGLLRRHL